MKKKIGIDQLQPGMYIADLNCGWLDHGFLRSRFLVESDIQLHKVRRLGVRELYIDTDKGLDVTLAPTASEVEAALEQGLVEMAATDGSETTPDNRPTPLASERLVARRIQNEAIGLVGNLMEDARLGRAIEPDAAVPLIEQMIDSLARNQDALLSLTRIRRVGRYTFEHSVNVAVLLLSLARGLELERAQLQQIGLGALLHDLGKILVPPAILNKPGQLTDEEFGLMRAHVDHTRALLAETHGLSPTVLAVAAEHHERIDGSGYPARKVGDQISLYGQMAAIVDVYDAITSDRVYHKALDPHRALSKMLEWSRHHFDPLLVQRFIRCVGIYPIGTLVRLHSGRLGVVVESGEQGPFHPVVRIIIDANRRRFLKVEDLDLSRLGKGSEERITGAESPQTWGIKPDEILRLPA